MTDAIAEVLAVNCMKAEDELLSALRAYNSARPELEANASDVLWRARFRSFRAFALSLARGIELERVEFKPSLESKALAEALQAVVDALMAEVPVVKIINLDSE